MTAIAKRRDAETVCSCGRADCDARTLEVIVESGHVRRAIIAANAVDQVAHSGERPKTGVVFMTALLLIERLAHRNHCDPVALLQKMASCFELKRRDTARSKYCN
jgi:hypothetical protein